MNASDIMGLGLGLGLEQSQKSLGSGLMLRNQLLLINKITPAMKKKTQTVSSTAATAAAIDNIVTIATINIHMVKAIATVFTLKLYDHLFHFW